MSFLNFIPLIGNAIQGVTDLVGTALTNKANKDIASEANRFNAEQSQLQYNRTVDLWNMQNEYNTPANQIKRLEEAGLSPYLAYSNGSAGGTASSMSAPSAVRAQVPEYKSPVSALANLVPGVISLMSGIEQVKAQQLRNDKQRIENRLLPSLMEAKATQAQYNANLIAGKYGYMDSIWKSEASRKDYEARMLKLKHDILEKYGMNEAQYKNAVLNNRASATSYDSQLAQAKLNFLQNELQDQSLRLGYYNTYGYGGAHDWAKIGLQQVGSALGTILSNLIPWSRGLGRFRSFQPRSAY